MKYLIIMITFISSCQSAEYTFKMTEPIESSLLNYENDTMKLIIDISKVYVSNIDLRLTNKLNTPLKIIWDDMSFSKNGNTSRIIHKNTKYIDKNTIQPNTNIPPNSYIIEVIAPTDYTVLKCDKNQLCRWVSEPIFPAKYNHKIAQQTTGQNMSFMLVYEIDKKQFNKSFSFNIDKVSY